MALFPFAGTLRPPSSQNTDWVCATVREAAPIAASMRFARTREQAQPSKEPAPAKAGAEALAVMEGTRSRGGGRSVLTASARVQNSASIQRP